MALESQKVLYLTSPLPPSVNHYIATRTIIKNGRPMALVYETTEAKEYKAQFKKYIINQVREQKWTSPENEQRHFYVDCLFYFARIDKDANNYFKCMLDAITETQLVWKDDNIVCERVNGIFYDKQNPRVEMVIRPVEYIGIFNNEIEKEIFENKCKNCSRYSNNCSILRKAIEGRVQPEIVSGQCEKYKEPKSKRKE